MSGDREKLVELLCQATFGVNKQTIDSYLPPSAIAEVAEHFLSNGVIVLPCKVGDTVYSKDGKECEIMDICIGKNEIAAQVNFECDYNCENCAFNSWHTEFCGENSCDGEWGLALVQFSEIGKTVFLTREEAEAALKEGQ